MAANFTGEAWIGERVLKQTHGELDTKNPVDSIVDSAHGDNVVLNLVCQIINEFCVGERNHHLHIVCFSSDYVQKGKATLHFHQLYTEIKITKDVS